RARFVQNIISDPCFAQIMDQCGQGQVMCLAPAPTKVTSQALGVGCHPARVLISYNVTLLNTSGKRKECPSRFSPSIKVCCYRHFTSSLSLLLRAFSNDLSSRCASLHDASLIVHPMLIIFQAHQCEQML